MNPVRYQWAKEAAKFELTEMFQWLISCFFTGVIPVAGFFYFSTLPGIPDNARITAQITLIPLSILLFWQVAMAVICFCKYRELKKQAKS